ncbi:MAG: Yip1 family protein [Casimicrobiaceae bacterium]
MALVDRLKGILFEPRKEWPKIAAETATPQSIYATWVCLFAAIGPLALIVAGGAGGGAKFAVGTYIMSLVITFILALLIDALAPSFGGTKDFIAALKLSAYSYTAAWIAGVFNLLGMLGGILALLAAIYSWYTFYLGAPVLKKSSQEKAVPFTIVIVLCGIGLGLLFSFALAGLGFIPRLGGIAMAPH